MNVVGGYWGALECCGLHCFIDISGLLSGLVSPHLHLSSLLISFPMHSVRQIGVINRLMVHYRVNVVITHSGGQGSSINIGCGWDILYVGSSRLRISVALISVGFWRNVCGGLRIDVSSSGRWSVIIIDSLCWLCVHIGNWGLVHIGYLGSDVGNIRLSLDVDWIYALGLNSALWIVIINVARLIVDVG